MCFSLPDVGVGETDRARLQPPVTFLVSGRATEEAVEGEGSGKGSEAAKSVTGAAEPRGSDVWASLSSMFQRRRG